LFARIAYSLGWNLQASSAVQFSLAIAKRAKSVPAASGIEPSLSSTREPGMPRSRLQSSQLGGAAAKIDTGPQLRVMKTQWESSR
jgi:hypothetical protein